MRAINLAAASAVTIAGLCAAIVPASAATTTITSGTQQTVINEPVCRSEFAPVSYNETWRAQTVTIPSGVHVDLQQHGTVSWTQDGVTYAGSFNQSASDNYAQQDVLRDDLIVEAAGSDGSQVHAWVRIIGQVQDGQVHLVQWNVSINC